MSFRLNTLEEIKDFFAKYSPGMAVCISDHTGSFHTTSSNIPWNFSQFHYSLVKTLPSIDWNHVHEKFKYMATDSDGISYLYAEQPTRDNNEWYVDSEYDEDFVEASSFKSYKPGNVDWKDSLVKREQIRGRRANLFIFDDTL